MRTSRTSQETTKILQALSPRRTRGSANLNLNLQSFAYDNPSEVKDEDVSSLSSINTVDIEDILKPPAKRRKAASASAAPVRAKKTTETTAPPPPTKRARRTPARKIKTENGSPTVQPPSDWETIYNTVKGMRERNPTAPVDTMGCAELYWRASSAKDQRFHILVALMLSSQTKDTVTAVAMQRLHTELGEPGVKEEDDVKKEDGVVKQEDKEDGIKTEDDVKKENDIKQEHVKKEVDKAQPSTLTLKNILAVSPQRLNELIRTVGFHNNKTKYIKAAAQILHDKYNSDIPSTAPELMSLPGVGPKMAYLCMSAAWGKHDGIGVDVHVHRITNLWGWHKTKNPEETRAALESWLPRDKWHEINKLLVGLGQTVCLPVGRRCGECDLAGTKLCKSEVRGK